MRRRSIESSIPSSVAGRSPASPAGPAACPSPSPLRSHTRRIISRKLLPSSLALSKFASIWLPAVYRKSLTIPNLLNNGIATGYPLRYPYPGEGGSRNAFRGDGYFEQDAGLSKIWKVYRNQTLRFDWEVFNVTNSSRFDTSPISKYGGLNASVTSGAGFGTYSSSLVQTRKQQFSLRYDF